MCFVAVWSLLQSSAVLLGRARSGIVEFFFRIMRYLMEGIGAFGGVVGEVLELAAVRFGQFLAWHSKDSRIFLATGILSLVKF